MVTCKEVATALASDAVRDSGLKRRLAIWLHLAICGYCRCYARQIRKLGAGARRLLKREAADPAALARLEERLIDHCRRPAGEAEPAD